MGDINYRTYLKKHLPKVDGPVLEVGSKECGSTQTFRDLYPGEYVGVDIEPGDGVDVVHDITTGPGPLPENHFGLVTCCSILEHVPYPWKIAENLSKLVKKGGYVYVCGPWSWRYHPYPQDYYRFSFFGIMTLFPEFKWRNLEYSSNVENEFVVPDKDDLKESMYVLESKMRRMEDDRLYVPYLNINMLGKKK